MTVNLGKDSNQKDENKSTEISLHLGGLQKKDGWKILNLVESPDVDYVGNAADLSQFKNGSINQIYASHVYEHLDYTGELQRALAEAFRVLKPGGILGVGVPDLDVLCALMLKPDLSIDKKFHVMRMIYGGHIQENDYHYVGFTFQILGSLLHKAGFNEISRIKTFNLFEDTTNLVFEGELVSLNVIAKKPLSAA